MHRRIAAGLVLVALAAGFAPAPKPKPKPKGDPPAPASTSGIKERKSPPKAPPPTEQGKKEKGQWSFQHVQPDGSVRTTVTYTIKVDTAKKPAWIDMESDRAGRTVTLTGLYELDGDTLKTCYVVNRSAVRPGGKTPPAKARPKSLTE